MSDAPQHIENILSTETDGLDTITSRGDLRTALWNRDEALFDALPGATLTAVARALSWDSFEFPARTDRSRRRKATILEEVNTRTLAVLAPDGTVYQLGDVIRFETTRSRRGWGRASSSETVTRENQIDYLSDSTASISRLPTYSNVPSDSPTAFFDRTDIELVSRSDLDDYRTRLTEGTDIDIPDTVNGWELVEVETVERDGSILPTNLVTKMRWSNGERATVTACWRGSYNVWYLSTPAESVLTDANEDDYLYEIDVPQQVVRTSDILALARDVMLALDPDNFQAPYDLRTPDQIDTPCDLRAGPVPITLPDQIGDWTLTSREKGKITWRNDTTNSAWQGFTVRLDSSGGTIVWNEDAETAHDRRLVENYLPNGDPDPDNITAEYAWRRRDMFEDNWYHAVAFMIQTSTDQPDADTLVALTAHVPEHIQLDTFEHGLNMDPHKTMDRDNGTLLAYN